MLLVTSCIELFTWSW